MLGALAIPGAYAAGSAFALGAALCLLPVPKLPSLAPPTPRERRSEVEEGDPSRGRRGGPCSPYERARGERLSFFDDSREWV